MIINPFFLLSDLQTQYLHHAAGWYAKRHRCAPPIHHFNYKKRLRHAGICLENPPRSPLVSVSAQIPGSVFADLLPSCEDFIEYGTSKPFFVPQLWLLSIFTCSLQSFM